MGSEVNSWEAPSVASTCYEKYQGRCVHGSRSGPRDEVRRYKKKSRVESGRSGRHSKPHTGLVGSGQKVFKYHGAGRVNLIRSDPRGVTRPVKSPEKYQDPFFFHTFLLSSFWTSRGHRCRPFFPPSSCLQVFIARRVQQSHCSSIIHRVLLTHALALSASQFGHKKKSPRIYSSMHSAGLELTEMAYTRLDDNLTRHRGDRPLPQYSSTTSSIPRYSLKDKHGDKHKVVYRRVDRAHLGWDFLQHRQRLYAGRCICSRTGLVTPQAHDYFRVLCLVFFSLSSVACLGGGGGVR